MCKKLMSLALAFLLVLAIVPTAAFAAGDPKVGAPQNVALYEQTANDGSVNGLGLKLTFDAAFLKQITPISENDSYGPYCARIYYECKVDSGAWFSMPEHYYDSFWNSGYETGGTTYDNAYFLNFQPGYGAQAREESHFANLLPLLKKAAVDGEADSYVLDGANHTLEVRVRYEMIASGDTEAATVYTSPWTTAKWGKGAAVVKPASFPNAPALSDIKIQMDGINHAPQVHFTVKHPADVMTASTSSAGVTCFRLEVNYDGVGWQFYHMADLAWLSANGSTWTNLPERDDGKAIVIDATRVQLRMRYEWFEGAVYHQLSTNGDVTPTLASPWSNIIGVNADAWSQASQWATPELEKAEKAGLIPDVLRGQDLTKDITRAEFAALSVRLYEVMSGKTAVPAPQNPFTDTSDPEILKAYALGITNGTSATTFSPSLLIPREQVAAMLTRTVRAVKPTISLDATGTPVFADDALISSWAKESVYFMAKHEIIKGVGAGKFAPRNTTDAEQAAGYANATREQSLIIASRSLEKLR